MNTFSQRIKIVLTCFLFTAIIFIQPVFSQTGKVLHLDGSGAYMRVTSAAALNIDIGQSYSITAWLKTADYAKRIISKRNGAAAGYEFINNSQAGGGQFGVNLSNTTPTSVGPPYGIQNITNYQWHHLAMVVNVSANTCKIYVDGSLERTSTNALIGSSSFSNTSDLFVGTTAAVSSFLRGQLDDIRFWSVALLDAQVLSDMTATITGPTTNLVAAWDFENVSGTTVPDITGNGYAGTLNGNAAIINLAGKALSLNGTNQYMWAASHADLNIAAGQRKTITCWIKTTTTSQSRIIAKRANADGTNRSTGGTSGTGYEIWTGSGANAGKIAGNAEGSINATTNTTFSTTGYNAVASNDGSWHHVAAVFDNASTNKKVTLYVDGINPNTRGGTFKGTYNFSNLVNLFVGVSSGLTDYFNGQIDDIRFWNRAMTPAELQVDMTTAHVNNNSSGLLAAWDFENASGATVPDVSGRSHPGTLVNTPSIVPVNPGGMTYTGASLYQTQVPVGRGKNAERVIRINITTSGAASPLSISSLSLSMNGTTNTANVTGVNVYYTGNNSRFNTSSLFGTAASGSGTIAVTGTRQLAQGNNYFWIAYDISSAATEGDVVDATCEGFTLSATAYTLSSPANSVAGSRTILLNSEVLFTPGDAGSVSYRIPAIVTAADGSLVTVTDKRNNNTGDLPNDIDLVVRRSTDKGLTWTAPVTIAGTASAIGSGDAALVVNRNNGEIICLYAYDQGFFGSTPANRIRIRVMKSADNGVTWNTPVDITNQIYGTGNTDPVRQNWYAVFVSSGAALQLRSGRIAAAIVVRQTSSTSQIDNFMMYSDDGGTTWSVTANAAEIGGDESKLVELNDGKLLMSIRNSGTRRFNKSTTSVTTWNSSNAYNQADITDPNCNGEILRYTSTLDGDAQNRLLHSIPFAGNRSNVSVLLSKDEGTTWPTRKTIYPGLSAYSTMTVLPDKTIGMYYENGEDGDVYQMHFVRFSNFFLTSGLENPLPPSPVTFSGKAGPSGAHAILNWITTDEAGIDRFEVEMSTNGEHFYHAGAVPAKGNDVIGNFNYTLSNKPSVTGTLHYRLKVIENDGRFTYSKVISIKLNETGKRITVFPNPAKNHIIVGSSVKERSTLQVVNTGTGIVVKSVEVNVFPYTLEIGSLPAGSYLVKVITGDKTEIKNFVKVR